MTQLRDLLCRELKRYSNMSGLSVKEVQEIGMILDAVKDIDTINAMNYSDYIEGSDDVAHHLETVMSVSGLSLADRKALKKAIEMIK